MASVSFLVESSHAPYPVKCSVSLYFMLCVSTLKKDGYPEMNGMAEGQEYVNSCARVSTVQFELIRTAVGLVRSHSLN